MRWRSLLLIAATVCCSCSDDGDHALVRTRASSIQGGRPDPKHPFAVGITAPDGSTCSGTLIAPSLVLTARHCLAATPDSIDCATTSFGAVLAGAFIVTTDDAFVGAKHLFGATRVMTPIATKFCGNDIALLELDTPIDASLATPASPLVEGSMSDRTKWSTTFTAIGYGLTSPDASDEGTRRILEGIAIRCIPGDGSIDCAALGVISDNDREFGAGGGTCSGDSGSGALEQRSFDAGNPVVFGVLSRGYDTATTCGEGTYSRTDKWSSWLIESARDAAARGGYPVPAWAIAGRADAGGDALEAAPLDAPSDARSQSSAPSGGCTASSQSVGVWFHPALWAMIAAIASRRRARSPRTKAPGIPACKSSAATRLRRA